LYVTELIAKNLVNTMPEKTMMATFDHGVVPADSITDNISAAKAFMTELSEAGIDIVEVTNLLEEEGVDKFIVSWNELVASVASALEASK
jgi:transaldolase